MGAIGRFIGGGREKAGNIALLVAIAGVVLTVSGIVAIVIVHDTTTQAALGTVTASALGLVTGALGFVFGGAGKRD